MTKQRTNSPKDFFSAEEKTQIEQAISKLEQKTSAELRVHVERRKKKIDIMQQARAAFETLGMTNTNRRNGVLIFICPDSHEFSILGDILIDKEVPEGFWDETTQQTEEFFRSGKFGEGVISAITKIGEKLKQHFESMPDDKNELPDDISSKD